ncbi:MAG: inositol monophosphatase [Alphaproteobacteria bacterium]|nr:inositol monophosphatase [Alphaproteobacteria bacterium]
MGTPMDQVAAAIRTVAAAEILPRFRNLGRGEVREKTGPDDLVTEADLAAERALGPVLRDLLPGSVVIGEEAASADPALLDRMAGEAPVWLIDPVDGTINFAAGKPLFATVVGLVRHGRCVAGWIFDPVADRMARVEAGSGAELDGKRLRVAAPAALSDMAGSLNVRFLPPPERARFDAARGRLGRDARLLAASQEYIELALGRTHFAYYARILPWDHAAGQLLHGEAGGYSAKLDGSPYRPTDRAGGLLLAPDAASWRSIKELLAG